MVVVALLGVFVAASLCIPSGTTALPTVHLIPHSHCDPGWLDTFETYYTRDVRQILSSVLSALSHDESKRFVWSETSFFSRWYDVQSPEARARFLKVLRRGQFEFVGGGWSQHDEACPDPEAVISQTMVGHQYLLDNFGVQPRVGWQVDPFGHSAVTPSLMALMGFDALVINRIHYAIKAEFRAQRSMEFLFRGNDVGAQADMFTHVLHTHYSAPPGFDWEEPGSQPVNRRNAHERAIALAEILRERMAAYRTDHLLVPWGDDFKFRSAQLQFQNMDRIVETVAANPERYGMHLRYSTVGEYVRAVQASAAESGTRFPVITGDFFPYADNSDSYWVGYFTTRPLLKAASRQVGARLRAAEALLALVRSNPDPAGARNPAPVTRDYWEAEFARVLVARRDSALFLHHDAITGTSRSTVVADYMARMHRASARMAEVVRDLLQRVLRRHPGPEPPLSPDAFVMVPRSRYVYPVVLYNSLGWSRRELVTVRTTSPHVWVTDSSGTFVQAQAEAYFPNVDAAEPRAGEFVVRFVASLPPLGAATYFVTVASRHVARAPATTHGTATDVCVPAGRHSTASRTTGGALEDLLSSFWGGGAGGSGRRADPSAEGEDGRGPEGRESAGPAPAFEWARQRGRLGADQPVVLENDLLTVTLSPQDGLLESVTDRRSGRRIEARLRFFEYQTSRSGAYIFRPGGRSSEHRGRVGRLRVTRGPLASSFSVRFGRFEVRGVLASGSDPDLAGHLELALTASARPNEEVVARFSTSVASGETFFTSSGIEFEERQRAERPLAANFYPMVAAARLASQKPPGPRFTLVGGHTVGCGSQAEGELELMLHRSLEQDDGRGLSQAVHDPTLATLPLWLYVDGGTGATAGPSAGAAAGAASADPELFRDALRLNHPPLALFATLSPERGEGVSSPREYAERYRARYEPMGADLPADVHLQSLAVRDGNSDDVVLRLHSLAGAGPGSNRTVDLASIFSGDLGFGVTQVREATLTANQEIPFGRYLRPRLEFAAEGAADDEAPAAAVGGWFASGLRSGAASAEPLGRQNAAEAGVFISNAALRKGEAGGAVDEPAAGGPRRGRDDVGVDVGDRDDVEGAADAGDVAADERAAGSESQGDGDARPAGSTRPPWEGLRRSMSSTGSGTPLGRFSFGVRRLLAVPSGDDGHGGVMGVSSGSASASGGSGGEQEPGGEVTFGAFDDRGRTRSDGGGGGERVPGTTQTDAGRAAAPAPLWDRSELGGSLVIGGRQLRTLVVSLASSAVSTTDEVPPASPDWLPPAELSVAGGPSWWAPLAAMDAGVDDQLAPLDDDRGGGGAADFQAPDPQQAHGGTTTEWRRHTVPRPPRFVMPGAAGFPPLEAGSDADRQSWSASVSHVSPLADNVEPWARLLPWGTEYVGILLIAVAVAIFYARHLRVVDDGNGFPAVPGLRSTSAGRAELARRRAQI